MVVTLARACTCVPLGVFAPFLLPLRALVLAWFGVTKLTCNVDVDYVAFLFDSKLCTYSNTFSGRRPH